MTKPRREPADAGHPAATRAGIPCEPGSVLPCLLCRTKIVCTLGPASDSQATIREMILAGMAVARINFSHGTHEENGRRIARCRAAARECGVVVGILADLQGPKLRIGTFTDGKERLKVGQPFVLYAAARDGDEHGVYVPHPEVLQAISRGDHILLGDGDIELASTGTAANGDVSCEVVVGGVLSSHKGITVPGVPIHLPAITDKDRDDLQYALGLGVDFVAQSFVQQAADIDALRALINGFGRPTPIVAKIERRNALECFDAIVATADAIMVARGDLGLELPAEEVPIEQKMVIRKAREAGKPVITATQMLESMLTNPRPTRAEASDVANAILDGTDAVMLSGETATGKYPVAAVRMMRRIAGVTEAHLPYRDHVHDALATLSVDVTDAVSQATCEIATELGAKAIVAATMSGFTARMVAKYRPQPPIVAVTPDPAVQGQLALVWGVVPLVLPHFQSSDQIAAGAAQALVSSGILQPDDLVVLTAGVPLGGPGRTNMIRIHRLSEILPQ
jgi:pyruvate kinase